MNYDVVKAMAKNIKTTEQYFNGYMETIEKGNVNANVKEVTLNAREINSRADLIIEQTHFAGNPIYTRNFEYVSGRKKDLPYNRAKVNRQTKQAVDNYEKLTEEELEMLN